MICLNDVMSGFATIFVYILLFNHNLVVNHTPLCMMNWQIKKSVHEHKKIIVENVCLGFTFCITFKFNYIAML